MPSGSENPPGQNISNTKDIRKVKNNPKQHSFSTG
jgi:hypothetical protein